QQELWHIHRQMDFEEIVHDPDTLALVNFELCVERAGALLLNPPRPEQLQEATRLLNLVASQRHDMLPRCDYWRAVACIHQRQYEPAAEHLDRVLSSADTEPKNPHRQRILFQAWQLALSHPEMRRRVAEPHLAQPGGRLEAIAAVERRLAAEPQDP